MGVSWNSISVENLLPSIGTAACPELVDVRRADAYAAATDILPTAVWRDPAAAHAWIPGYAQGADVVVYCVHGHQVSQGIATLLAAAGVRARYLHGGIEGYRAAGGLTVAKSAIADGRPSRWITRERPKIDRIACPWLIRRFVDRNAAIHFVAADWVSAVAKEIDAIAFDIPDTAFSHRGDLCSFDAFLQMFRIQDPALDRLADIVRGADTGQMALAPECAGLLAVSLGLSATRPDDADMLAAGMTVYDALYGWCRYASQERHAWPSVQSVSILPEMRP